MIRKILVGVLAFAAAGQASAITINPIIGGTQSAVVAASQINPSCLGSGALTPNGGTLGDATGHAGYIDTGGTYVPVYSSAWEFDVSPIADATMVFSFDWQNGQGDTAGFCVIGYSGDGTMSGAAYVSTRSLLGTFSANDTTLVGGVLTQVDHGHISMVIPNLGGIMGLQIVSPAQSADRYFSNVSLDVPEPAMVGLFGIGALGLGLNRRRKAA